MFVAATLAGLGVLVWLGRSGPAELWSALAGARPAALAAGLAVVAADLGIAGTRIWVLARHFHPGFRWLDGLRTQLYNLVAAAVTPMQSGGGPIQYYMLRRAGLPGGRSLAVLTANWVGILSAFVGLGSLGLLYLVQTESFALRGFLRALFLTAFFVGLAALTVTLFPDPLQRLLVGVRRLRRARVGRRLLMAVGRYRVAVRRFRREGLAVWLANIGLAWLLILNRCLAGVAALAALRVEADPLSAIARQALQFAIIYVSPTPGGSGIAEASSLGFMAGLVPAALLLAYTVLWRAFTGYAQLGVAAVYVTADVAREAARLARSADPARRA